MITINDKGKEEGTADGQLDVSNLSTGSKPASSVDTLSNPAEESAAKTQETKGMEKAFAFILIPEEKDERRKKIINDLLIPAASQGASCHSLDETFKNFVKGCSLAIILNPFTFADFANGFDSAIESLSDGKSEDDVKALLSKSSQDFAKQLNKDIAKFVKDNGLISAVVVNKKMIRKDGLLDFYNKVDGAAADEVKALLISSTKKANVETLSGESRSSLTDLIKELAVTVSEDDVEDNLADLESSIKLLIDKINAKKSKLTEAVLGKTILIRN